MTQSPGGLGGRLYLTPMNLKTAVEFVAAARRCRLGSPAGHKFSVGVADADGVLRGVVVVCRPMVGSFDNGQTLEVVHCATDGGPGVEPMLLDAAWRAAAALGHTRLVARVGDGAPAGRRAAGYRVVEQRPAHPMWSGTRRRETDGPTGQPALWETP